LIVIPFRLLRPDPGVDFLSFGLADAIATTLSNLDSMIVRSGMTAVRFATDQLDLKRLAADAEVDAVLTGTLLRVGDRLRVNAQLLSAPQGTIVWSERMDVPVSDVIRVQDELSERIADSEVVFAGAWAPRVVAMQIPRIVAATRFRVCMMSSCLH